jgi:NADH-quinone oxidoreductase subunit E
VCAGTACYVRGGPRILDSVERTLNIRAGETTKDGKFTLETVNCLGCCALGPVVEIDGQYHGKLSSASAEKLLSKYN